VVSWTATSKVPVALLPALSVAEQSTVSRPAGKAGRSGFLLGLSWVVPSVYRTHRRVKRALRASVPAGRSGSRGLRRTVLSGAAALLVPLGALVAPLLVWIFPVAALYFGYLQARLNKTWAKQGTPLVAASQF
jgi:hypothetical protein